MKQITTSIIAIAITLTSFASVKPVKIDLTSVGLQSTNSFLKLSLVSGGKVSLKWKAGIESTTTSYNIEKSVNGGAFKVVAILMGESQDSYLFRDSLKDANGSIVYRIVMVDQDRVISTLSQSVVVL